MAAVPILAIDLTKRSFQVCATDRGGAVLFNRVVSRTKLQQDSKSEILAEPVDLVHALMQDRDNADVPVRETPPIHDMPLVAEHKAIDVKCRRNRPRHHRVRLNTLEGFEQSSDVRFRLFRAPAVTRVAIDVVETMGGRLLNPNGHGQISVGCAR